MKIHGNEKKLINEFFRLVKIDSESLHCGQMIKYLKENLKKRWKMSVYEQKTDVSSNLIANWGSGPNSLMLSAHMDTVAPGRGIQPAVVKNKIVSKGDTILGSDDKAAAAVYLYTLDLIKKYDIPVKPLEFVFTYGEEIGLLGAKALDYSRIKSKKGICFDADGDVGQIYVSAPYYFQFDIKIIGKAAHSGIEPEKGISAVKVLAEIISKIKTGRLNKTTTLNIGLIKGGTALNIVPPEAEASGEIRSVLYKNIKKEFTKIQTIVKTVSEKYKVRFKIKGKKIFDGFLIDEKDNFLSDVAESVKKQNITPVLKHSNGGSDANIFNSRGIKTLNLAVGMENAHTVKEYIKIKNLKSAVSVLLQIISETEVKVLW